MTRIHVSEAVQRRSNLKASYRYAGSSLLELIVGIVIVGVMGALLTERMLRYQEYAEKTAMEVTARKIQTGLRMAVADLMMRDQMHDIDRVLKTNPITLLETPPSNYVGEYSAADKSDIARGTWHFDSLRNELVYVPFHRRFFRPKENSDFSVRYRISGTKPAIRAVSQRTEGLALLLISPYKWEVQLDWNTF